MIVGDLRIRPINRSYETSLAWFTPWEAFD